VLLLLASVGSMPVAAAGLDPELAAAEALFRGAGAETALPVLESLLERFRSENKRPEEAHALHFIGACHWQLGNLDQARRNLDSALAMRRELGDRLGEAKTANVLGLVEWNLGNYDAAMAYFRGAHAVGREIGHALLQGVTLNNLSLVYDELGEYQTSLEQYERVLEIYRNADHPHGESETYGNIGGVYLLLGRYRTAIDYYEKALAISERLESKPSMSLDHGNLGWAHLGLGAVDTALAHFDTAIEYAAEAGMKRDEAMWMRGKGNALVLKGRHDEGLASFRAALAAYEQVGAKGELLEAMHDMGQLHLSLGDPTSAEQYFRQAIALAREIGHARGITWNLIALGKLYLRRELHDEAALQFTEARDRAVQSGEQSQLAESLLGLAYVHQAKGQFEPASASARQALSIAREIGAKLHEAEALYVLAETERQEQSPQEALASFAAAEAILTETGDADLLWQIYFGQAKTYETLGDKAAAIDSLKQSVQLIESVRNRLREERFRSGYLQDKHQVYVELVRLLLEMDLAEEAFGTAERLRARSYAEQFERKGMPMLSDLQQKREFELRERVRQLQRALIEEESQPRRRQAAVQTFSAELILAEREYQAFLDDHAQASPAGDVVARMPSSREIGKRLLRDEVLVEFVVGENEIMIFALSDDELFATVEPVRQVDMHARVELLRDLISRPGDDRWQKPAQAIATVLIEPLERAGVLEDVGNIYLVPHGILNYLPFSLLPLDGPGNPALLFERYKLAYLPTALSLGGDAQARTGPATLLAVAPAHSRLRFAPDEARSINALFEPDSRLLLGVDATESRFKDLAGDFRMLHLATHSDFNKLNPMFSGLQLEPDDANDGKLEVHEVLRLELDADLVTLSACDTALGSGYFAEVPAGDEFVGLTRAFLSVGSDAIMATLWEVDDRSSIQFMQQFYERLEGPGANKDMSAALMLAQQQLRATKGYDHPYYWAPFVLVGKMSHSRQAQALETTL
jgi:CHAT domain-containing protein